MVAVGSGSRKKFVSRCNFVSDVFGNHKICTVARIGISEVACNQWTAPAKTASFMSEVHA